jgi:hypothetical protein
MLFGIWGHDVGRVAQMTQGLVTGWTVRGSNPAGGEIFRTCPDRPWCPLSLLHNEYRVFPGGKGRPGRDADPSPLLVPWSRKGSVIPLLPLWAVRPVQSLSGCTRLHFTLLLPYSGHDAVYLSTSLHTKWRHTPH